MLIFSCESATGKPHSCIHVLFRKLNFAFAFGLFHIEAVTEVAAKRMPQILS